MKKILTTLAIASLGFICSCDLLNPNNDPQLPPITTEGKGTFGCLVNGKLFLPEAPFGYGTGVRAELYINDTVSSVNIYSSNTDTKQSFIITILDKPEFQIGYTYDLSDTTCCGVQYTNYKTPPTCRYQTVISGSVKLLRFDITNPQNKIIAGTFEFVSSSGGCNNTVKVMEGRFDIGDVTQ